MEKELVLWELDGALRGVDDALGARLERGFELGRVRFVVLVTIGRLLGPPEV